MYISKGSGCRWYELRITRRTYRCCIKRPFTDQSFYKLKLILDFYFISGALRESASIMDVRTLMGGGVIGQLTPNVLGPVGEGYNTGQGHAITLRKNFPPFCINLVTKKLLASLVLVNFCSVIYDFNDFFVQHLIDRVILAVDLLTLRSNLPQLNWGVFH